MTVHPAKTHISLGVCPVWTESLLCAQWVAKDPRSLHPDSEDSDQTGGWPGWSESWLGAPTILLVLSWGDSFLDAIWIVKPHYSNLRIMIASFEIFMAMSNLIWATPWENLFMPYEINKGTDQPAHMRSLICAFVVCWLNSIIPLVSISKISSLYLGSLAAQAGVTIYLVPRGQADPGYLTPYPGYLHPRGASCQGWFISPPPPPHTHPYRGNNLIWYFQFICNILWYLRVFLKL